MSPRVRKAAALLGLAFFSVLWPLRALAYTGNEIEILHLSYGAIWLTFLDLAATTDVRAKGDTDE